MNIQRFTAPTSREALAKARAVFGEGTLILSNRPVQGGVEVVATAEEALAALDLAAVPENKPAATATVRPVAVTPTTQASGPTAAASTPDQDSEQLAMSTLSFQDYVRERMLRRRHDASQAAQQSLQQVTRAQPATATPVLAQSAPVDTAPLSAPTVPAAPPSVATPAIAATVATTIAPAMAAATPRPAAFAPIVNPQGIVNELQAMKALIDERFNTLAWLGETRQDPIRANLVLKLIRAGYSPTLSRTLIEQMPEGGSAGDSVRWLTRTLERSLHTDSAGQRLIEEGGIFALVGATGVGKTTTVAKLAGLCARAHGTASVGLVTLDTFRVGAHEQLRAHARQFGVVAHQAHDRAALAELLNLFANRHMVLVDTTGVAPSDPRMRGMLDMLDLPGVNRLLVLNAGAHGDTLDQVLSSFKGTGTQHAILSKLDEAVKLGPALDTLIRHQFVLRGVTNGQRVPDDWGHADATALVAQSMRAPARSAFDPQASDLNFFFSPESSAALQGEVTQA